MTDKIKAFANSLLMLLKQIASDAMLVVVIVVPFIAGSVFRFVLPFLAEKFSFASYIEPYYLLIDLLLCSLSPYMFCFVSSMCILGDIDEHVHVSYFVTPLARRGYIVSRLVIPAAAGALLTVVVISLFHLTPLSWGMRVSIAVLTSLTSLIATLFVVSVASNKVEGMALGKISGILMMGIFIPFFASKQVWVYAAFLPSVWLARYGQTGRAGFGVVALAVSCVWIFFLEVKFVKKI